MKKHEEEEEDSKKVTQENDVIPRQRIPAWHKLLCVGVIEVVCFLLSSDTMRICTY